MSDPDTLVRFRYAVSVSSTFFETMEIPLVAGGGFTARDNQDAPRVVAINEAAARKYFPNESPILDSRALRRIRFPAGLSIWSQSDRQWAGTACERGAEVRRYQK